MSEEIKKEESKKTTKKKATIKKEPEVTITVDQFCRQSAVKQLDAWVAAKFWKDRKTVKEWQAAFDDKKIPYKR